DGRGRRGFRTVGARADCATSVADLSLDSLAARGKDLVHPAHRTAASFGARVSAGVHAGRGSGRPGSDDPVFWGECRLRWAGTVGRVEIVEVPRRASGAGGARLICPRADRLPDDHGDAGAAVRARVLS